MTEIKRDYYLDILKRHAGNGLVKIITGVRRCGKSYLLDPIFTSYLRSTGVDDAHIIKLSLDERQNVQFLNPDKLDQYVRNLIVDEKPYYVILDEVQEVKDFESVLIGFMHIPNVDVYATGSNSRFLSSDIVTEFRGRGDEIHVYPLSFAEALPAMGDQTYGALANYFLYGGLPLAVLAQNEVDKMGYLRQQVNNVYINDIVNRNHIRSGDNLEKLTEVIASNVGSLTNPTRLANLFSQNTNATMSEKTIYSYIGYLQDAFLIEKADRYDVRGNKYLETPQKYYFVDTGLRNAFLNFRQNDEISHLMENVIYLELRRRGYSVDVGDIDTWQNGVRKRLEVDFVANRGGKRIYIQSAYDMNSAAKKEQEERSLLAINDNYQKVIVVGDQMTAKSYSRNGTLIINVRDFLLNQNSLEY